MTIKEKNSRGYKPGQVCEILSITNETFRYWRIHLYPKNERHFFSLDDLFIFHFIKSFVKIKRVKVNELIDIDWEKILDQISKIDNKKKHDYVAVFDKVDLKFHFSESKKIDLSDDRYFFVFVRNIFNRFNDSIRRFVNDGSKLAKFNDELLV